MATPRPTAPAGARAPTLAQTHITFYAAYDNDPPGSDQIAYPNERHQTAGGVGTFEDPITLAADPREVPPGTVIYYPELRKYFVMEDDCAECIDDWESSRRPRVDLWASSTTDKKILDCEKQLTPQGLVTVEINPKPDHIVDTRPLYDSAGQCLSPH
jgi:3D (Asp-Asp-Asp) domain-containing protein